jgi:hypothetical protein
MTGELSSSVISKFDSMGPYHKSQKNDLAMTDCPFKDGFKIKQTGISLMASLPKGQRWCR